MSWFKNLSLKFKLILLLVVLTGTMLVTFGGIAIRDFEKDKIAYVLDTNFSQARSTALQIRTEVSFAVEKVKFLMRGYDHNANTFHPYANSLFPQETRLDILQSYYLDSTTGQYKAGQTLQKSNLNPADLVSLNDQLAGVAPQVHEDGVRFVRHTDTQKWILLLRFDRKDMAPLIVAAQLNDSEFLNTLNVAQIQDTYVVDEKNRLVLSPKEKTYPQAEKIIETAMTEKNKNIKSSDGVYQYRGDKSETLLLAFSDIGFGKLQVVSLVPKKAALEAVNLMVAKSLLVLGLLFCLTLFLSVLSSTTLTSSLKKLMAATSEVAQGNFDVTVEVNGQDEIGTLSSGFNKMTHEIQRLMLETAEKARMEGELKTAQLVQSTLFPTDYSLEENLEIKGFYQPASECSGDWWYYKKLGNKTLFCIGDATGHGVPAALLTAAARSAATTLETLPDMPLKDMLSIFNRSIYNTARGQVMMTMFLGLYNHETGVIKYCNASHEPPFLLPQQEGLKIKDLKFLNEVNGPRLGETLDSTYDCAETQLQPGDRVVLYTDGVTELKNGEDKQWGERAFLKCLIACQNENKDINSTIEQVNTELTAFRKEHPLQDDVTYFMLSRSKAA